MIGTRLINRSQELNLSSSITAMLHLLKKRGSSLLDEMDITMLTEAEILAIKGDQKNYEKKKNII